MRFEALERRCLLAFGDLDLSFGDQGMVQIPIPLGVESTDRVYDVAVQDDGRIVSVGEAYSGGSYAIGLTRVLPDGNPDIAFGGNGQVLAFVPAWSATARCVAIQPDEKIVVAVESLSQSLFLLRFDSDGSPDATFGDNGLATVELPDYTRIHDLAIQPDRKILVTGGIGAGNIEGYSVTDMLLVRLNEHGSLDTTFSGSGMIVTRITEFSDTGRSIFVDPDGDIAVAGIVARLNDPAKYDDDSWDLFVARFQENGAADRSFGEAGVLLVSLGNPEVDYMPRRVSVLGGPSKQLYVVSSKKNENGNLDLSVTRLNRDGSLDLAFGDQGTRLTPIQFSTKDVVVDVVQGTDGKVVVLGSSDAEEFLVRFNADFSLDTTFDGDGVAPIFPWGQEVAIALSPDSSIVLGGVLWRDPDDFGLSRVLPDGLPDMLFGLRSSNLADNLSQVDSVHAVVTLDDSVVLAGNCGAARGFLSLCLTKVLGDGTLDNAFGDGGKQEVSYGASGVGSVILLQQDDGKLLAVTTTYGENSGQPMLTLVRLNADGQLDATFGDGGWRTVDLLDVEVGPLNAVLDHDGGILLTMLVREQAEPFDLYYALIRITPDATHDTAFGPAGQLTLTDANSAYVPVTLVQSDGAIITVVSRHQQGSVIEEIRRWTPTGQPDLTWGDFGVTVTGGAYGNGCGSAAFLPNGEAFVACSQDSDHWRFFRLDATGRINRQFGVDGLLVVPYQDDLDSWLEKMVVFPTGDWITVRTARTRAIVETFTADGTRTAETGVSLGGIGSAATELAVTEGGDVIAAGDSMNRLDANFFLFKAHGAGQSTFAWTNPNVRFNVSGDRGQFVTPVDALVVINELNRKGARRLVPFRQNIQPNAYYDVNRDGWLTPHDALQVINFLHNQGQEGESSEGAVGAYPIVLSMDSSPQPIASQSRNGMPTARIRVQNSPALSGYVHRSGVPVTSVARTIRPEFVMPRSADVAILDLFSYFPGAAVNSRSD